MTRSLPQTSSGPDDVGGTDGRLSSFEQNPYHVAMPLGAWAGLTGLDTMIAFLKRFCRDDDGAAMVEYALLVALIALVAIVGVTATGTSLNAQFAKMSCKIATPSAECAQQ